MIHNSWTSGKNQLTLMQRPDTRGALPLVLDTAQITRLNEVSEIDLGFPRTFLDLASHLIFGASADQIQNHRRF